MKIRTGFVSNSSSSSYIIGVKGEFDEDRLKDVLIKLFAVPEESMMHPFSVECANTLSRGLSRLGNTPEELMKALYIDREDMESIGWKPLFDWVSQGFTLFDGSVSDEGGDAMEYWLTYQDINYESETLVIRKDGGY